VVKIESAKSPHLFLYIDLPKFDFPIVFAEPVRGFLRSATIDSRRLADLTNDNQFFRRSPLLQPNVDPPPRQTQRSRPLPLRDQPPPSTPTSGRFSTQTCSERISSRPSIAGWCEVTERVLWTENSSRLASFATNLTSFHSLTLPPASSDALLLLRSSSNTLRLRSSSQKRRISSGSTDSTSRATRRLSPNSSNLSAGPTSPRSSRPSKCFSPCGPILRWTTRSSY
jgi:hypothetical protein